MLVKIKEFFNAQMAPESQVDPEHQLQLAAAALLIELSRADYRRDPEEQQVIEQELCRRFDLDAQELETLIQLAEDENEEAVSLYQFTGLIREHYTQQQRFDLVKMLWQVAAADGKIDKHEDHMIRKVADLIYLPHSEFIRAKLEVTQA